MKHPNTEIFEKIYAHIQENQFEKALSLLPENVTFQVAGKSKLAGKFTKENFLSGYAAQLKELSQSTYQFQLHDILVSDLHATILATVKVSTHGKPVELRTVHVWRIDHGKPIAGYEYPRDLYQFDATWA